MNGHFQPALSNTSALSARLIIQPLHEAIRTYGTFLNNQWARSIKEEIDPFAVLNAALHQQGVFVYAPPKYQAECPIQILHVADAGDLPMFMNPRAQFFLGAQSSLNVVSSHLNLSGNSYFVNQAADFSFEDGAAAHYTQSTDVLPDSIWHFDAARAFLKRDGLFKTVSVTEGSATVRNDYRVVLGNDNSEALLNGLWMLSQKNEAHTHVLMDHQAPNCRSLQLFKGVLNDLSNSSFEGKILVRQAAQKTQAFQLNNNLLLSDRAHADSKPNLEIFADDVKASHGATVGQLDQEQLFYLATRGFSKHEAKNILVYGFCQEVIEMIPIPSLKKAIAHRAMRYVVKG